MVFFNILFMLCIIPICLGFCTVEPLQAVVIMFMGKVVKVQDKPGLSWYFPIGRANKTVSLGGSKSRLTSQESTPWNSRALRCRTRTARP